MSYENYTLRDVGAAIKLATAEITEDGGGPEGVSADDARAVIATLVHRMTDHLLTLRPRFDPERFLTAAGYPKPSKTVEAMVTRYTRDGASLAQIAREVGLSAGTVSQHLRDAGVQLRRGGPQPGQPRPPRKAAPDTATVKQMVARYTAGATLAEVGKEFGYHAATVAQHLRDAKVLIRRPGHIHRERKVTVFPFRIVSEMVTFSNDAEPPEIRGTTAERWKVLDVDGRVLFSGARSRQEARQRALERLEADTLVSVKLVNGTTEQVRHSTLDTFEGVDEYGYQVFTVDGITYAVTPCCKASGKGSAAFSTGVMCRGCSTEVDSYFGGPVTVAVPVQR